MDDRRGVREQRLHGGPVLGAMHQRGARVLGQRRAGVRPGRDLGNAGPVHDAGVRVGHVLRRVYARLDAVFGQRSPELQRHRRLERRERVPLRVRDPGPARGYARPERLRCSGDAVQTCDMTGTWGMAQPCTNAACSAGACTGVCTPGTTQCSGNGVMHVRSRPETGAARARALMPARWELARACARPDSTQCSGTGVQTCSDTGTFGTAVTLQPELRLGRLHGLVHPRLRAMLGQRRPGVRHHGDLERREPVRRIGVRLGRVRRLVRARDHAVLGQRRSRPAIRMATGERRTSAAPSRASRARARASARPGSTQCSGNGVQTCGAKGTWGTAAACGDQACVSGRMHGRLRSGGDAMLGQWRADVQHVGRVGYRGGTAATRPASTAPARARAAPGRRGATATACRRATRRATGAPQRRAAARRACRARALASCTPATTAVLGQRRPDLQRGRPVGHRRGVLELGVRIGRLLGVCAPGATQCSGNGVETCSATGQWAKRVALHVCLRERKPARASAFPGRRSARATACRPARRAARGGRPRPARAPRAWPERAPACASPGATGAPATACRRATRAASGARPRRARTRRASRARARACARRARRSARATASRRAAANGQWSAAAACTNSACVSGGCTGVCAPGAVAVLGQRRADVLRERHVGRARRVHRTPRAWAARAPASARRARPSARATAWRRAARAGSGGPRSLASGQACVSGACTGSCTPGNVQCSGNAVADVQQLGHAGAPPSLAPTRRASTACAAGRASPTSTAVQRPADRRPAAPPGHGRTPARLARTRRACPERARACAPRGRCSAAASSRRRAARRAPGKARAPARARRASTARARGVCTPGVDAVLGQRRADVPVERDVGHRIGVLRLGVRERRVHRRVRPWRRAVLRQRSADVPVERDLERGHGLRQPDLHHAAYAPARAPRAQTICSGQRGRDVHFERHLRDGRRVHQPGVRERCVHGRVHARRRAVLGQRGRRRASRTGNGGRASACTSSACVAGVCTGTCSPGRRAVLGQQRADLQQRR